MKNTQRKMIPASCALALLILLLGNSWGLARPDSAELNRTWEGSWVFAPSKSPSGYRRIDVDGLSAYKGSSAHKPSAIVLYAHGCDGLSRISTATARFLAQAGYLVIAPDSFARKHKPESCNAPRHLGGLHRAVLGWRQAELHYAYDRLMNIPALSDIPLLLMGHSEGAIAVATVRHLPAAGRIIEGWTCHAGWREYRGLKAPADEPVLALVGENDPWFQAPVLHGDCGSFMRGPHQRSIVYRPPNYLAGKHWLSVDRKVQETILGFIGKSTDVKRRNDARK